MSIESASARLLAEARFQDAYARFLTDDRFRERVLEPSRSEGVDLTLSGTDIDRLRAMDQSRVELFAQCLFGNRVAAIEEAFPLSAKVMGDRLPALVRLLDARDVAVDTRKYSEAVRFAEFVLNAGDGLAQALSDSVLRLLRYELIMLNLRVRPQLPSWPDSAKRSADSLRHALRDGRDVGLSLNQNHSLLTIGFDVDVLRDLPADAAPFDDAATEVIVLLHRGDDCVVHQMRLNQASAAAILMIDRTGTFRTFVSAYAAWLGRDVDADFENDLEELCIQLCDCGALCFEPNVPDSEKNGNHSPGPML